MGEPQPGGIKVKRPAVRYTNGLKVVRCPWLDEFLKEDFTHLPEKNG
jgi:hypothetical protein